MERLNNREWTPDRRGVLLLIVLSLLTLFMMLGATYLVLAARSRATARAFANAISGSQTLPPVSLGESLVDETFLRVVRGSESGSSGVIPSDSTLLADKYGTGVSLTGRIVSGSPSGSVVISIVVTGTNDAESLAGRVLTFTLPGLTNASVRILRAEPAGSNTKLFVPAGPTLSGVSLSASAITAAAAAVTGTTHFVINGREFSGSPSGNTDVNEPYDGYDGRNDFLANPLNPASRPSYSSLVGTSGTNLSVDNDGDGTLDSGWLDIGLPPITTSLGVVYPRAAILVTDLDGRLNVNAHGSRNPIDIPDTTYPGTLKSGSDSLLNVISATSSFATNALKSYPRGLGIGPAEISVESANVFESQGAGSAAIMLSGVDGVSDDVDSQTQRSSPKTGPAEGRYGGLPQTSGTAGSMPSAVAFPRPGNPYVNDTTTSLTQSWIASPGADYFTIPLRFGSPPDLKARGRIFLDDFGQPVYFKPYWSTSGTRAAYIDDETVDDPYELNLSRMAPRSGGLLNPRARSLGVVSGSSADYSSTATISIPDSLYAPGDLESLLRLFDIDSPKLPRRLSAIVGKNAGVGRLLLTTDSWDTSAMTGSARAAVSRIIATSSTAAGMTTTDAMAMFAPETLMGHKMDLNRPFHNSNASEPNDATGTAERLAFAKHLYSLCYATAGNGATISTAQAKELGQWVINVVDFRDDDSVMTGFEFDTNLTNGWNVDGDLSSTSDSDRAVAWGSERPEVLISETVCWHDRNTDDLSPSGNQLLTAIINADTDFDQARRPQGAFYFELYSPWRSQAAEYDTAGIKAVRRFVQGGTSSLLRAEPMASEFLSVAESSGSSPLARFDAGGAINLSGTSSIGGYPIWRLATFKNTTTGTTSDPLVGVSGTAWRTFYFRQPPVGLVRTGTNGDVVSGTAAVAYWPSAGSVTIAPQTPIVFGTGTQSPAVIVSSSFVQMTQLFLAPSGTSSTAATNTATLTEPAIVSGTNASYDPYAILHSQALPPTSLSWPLSGDSVNVRPLDDLTYSGAGITQLTGPTGAKTLFQNGRHSNYFTAHLQRLANPMSAWDAQTNPYITVDSLPIDLLVFNSLSDGRNYDEPCGPGSAFVALASDQRAYDDADTTGLDGAAAHINIERGKTETSGTNDRDVWSARINPNSSGDLKLLSIASTTRDANPVVANSPLSDVESPAHSGTSNHSLGKLPSQFVGSGTIPTKPFPWMVWNNRPFVSAAELSLVPKTSAFELLRQHCTAVASSAFLPPKGPFGHLPGFFEPVTTISSTSTLLAPWPAITGRSGTTGEPVNTAPSIWDAVHTPTPFGGSYQNVPTTPSGTAALAPLNLDKRPYGQIPHFREPGRININTITGTSVWTALLGTGTAGTATQTWSPSGAPFHAPATTLQEALGRFHTTVSGTTSFIDTYSEAARKADANAFFRYQTVNRMTNLVTVRSNVFAVWVTVAYFDDTGNEAGITTGEVRRHRGFYIFDRSIPVGFLPGQDLNVRDAILLRRIIQ